MSCPSCGGHARTRRSCSGFKVLPTGICTNPVPDLLQRDVGRWHGREPFQFAAHVLLHGLALQRCPGCQVVTDFLGSALNRDLHRHGAILPHGGLTPEDTASRHHAHSINPGTASAVVAVSACCLPSTACGR